MSKLFVARAGAALVGLLIGVASQEAAAWGELPIKVDTILLFKVNVRYGHQYQQKNAAPWWTYFPYDPRLMTTPQGSPYPTWPQPFPPTQEQPKTETPGVPSKGQATAPGWMYPQTAPPPQAAQADPLQNVGYHANQLPSYWYGYAR